MSIDRSFKTASGLERHRNVLTRAERIEHLASRRLFDIKGDNPLGLPKVANRKVVTGHKAAKKKEAEEAAAVEEQATTPAKP